MYSKMLELTLAFRANLEVNLAPLIAEVNLMAPIDVLIAVPRQIDLGIRTEMLERKLPELPALACGVYLREVAEEGEQDWSRVLFPWTIDVYEGDKDPTTLYIKSLKWALVLDKWTELHSDTVLKHVLGDEAPSIDISYTLAMRDHSHRQLISAVGVFSLTE